MREQDIEQRDQRAPQHGGRQDGGMTEKAVMAVRLAQSGAHRERAVFVIAGEAKESSPSGCSISIEEVRRQRRTPDREVFRRRGKILRLLRRIEEIAVAVVLDRVAEGILPVVEDLAADDVAADAPEVPPALRRQPFMAERLIVEIVNLEGGVVEMRLLPFGEGDGVVVGERGAA